MFYRVRRKKDGWFMDAHGRFHERTNDGRLWKSKGGATAAITRFVKVAQYGRPDPGYTERMHTQVLDFEVVEYELIERRAQSYMPIASKKTKEMLLKSISPMVMAQQALKERSNVQGS